MFTSVFYRQYIKASHKNVKPLISQFLQAYHAGLDRGGGSGIHYSLKI